MDEEGQTVQNISADSKYLYILTSGGKMVKVTYALSKNTNTYNMYVTDDGTLTAGSNPVIIDVKTDSWPVLNSRLPGTTATQSTDGDSIAASVEGDSEAQAVHNVTPTYYGAAAPKQKTATVAIKPQAADQPLTLASAQTGDSDSEDRKTQESTAPGGSSDSGSNADGNTGDESISGGDTNGSTNGRQCR